MHRPLPVQEQAWHSPLTGEDIRPVDAIPNEQVHWVDAHAHCLDEHLHWGVWHCRDVTGS